MFLQEIIANHDGRKFRRESWGPTLPSWFVGESGLSIRVGYYYGDRDGRIVNPSPDAIAASDWFFGEEEES